MSSGGGLGFGPCHHFLNGLFKSSGLFGGFLAAVAGEAVDDVAQLLENLLDVAAAIDAVLLALRLVIVDQRRGLCLVDAQAIGDGVFVVVGAVVQSAATDVAQAVHFRWRGVGVVHLSAAAAGATPGDALDQQVEIHVDEDRGLQGAAQLVEHGVEGLGLGDVAWEAVENEALFGVGLGHALLDHVEHDLVRNQLAGIHGGLGLQAKGGFRGDGGAQQVTGGYLWYAVVADQFLGLGSLARSWRANQDDPHVDCLPRHAGKQVRHCMTFIVVAAVIGIKLPLSIYASQ